MLSKLPSVLWRMVSLRRSEPARYVAVTSTSFALPGRKRWWRGEDYRTAWTIIGLTGAIAGWIWMYLDRPPRKLNARIEADRRYVHIMNRDTFDWVGCTLQINPSTSGECFYRAGTIYAGSTVKVSLFDFANAEGYRFNFVRRKVVRFEVRCSNGVFSQ